MSGEPYDQYIQRHLLDPLRMARSTATEPVPAALADRWSARPPSVPWGRVSPGGPARDG